jgi:hypothetical protein
MKHFRDREYPDAHGGALAPVLGLVRPALQPTRQEVRWGPILAQESVAVDEAERIVVKIIEWRDDSRLPPALMQERQKRARGGEWRPVGGFAVSFLHCHELRQAFDQVLALARVGAVIETSWLDEQSPVVAESQFPLNGLDRCALKVVDRRQKPRLLIQERQRLLSMGGHAVACWQVKGSFGVSMNHAQPILDSFDRLIERARG